uniref:Putative secreted protein n=1 Tax=Anopheles darlingi TaxID=43151 RepID=A0A2M4D334_ANODA
MWYLVLFVAIPAVGLYLVSRRWGRQLYYRWARFIPLRRVLGGKTRPPTPPLLESDGDGGSLPLSGAGGGSSSIITDFAGENAYLLNSSKEEYDDDRLHTVGKGMQRALLCS